MCLYIYTCGPRLLIYCTPSLFSVSTRVVFIRRLVTYDATESPKLTTFVFSFSDISSETKKKCKKPISGRRGRVYHQYLPTIPRAVVSGSFDIFSRAHDPRGRTKDVFKTHTYALGSRGVFLPIVRVSYNGAITR